MIRVLRSALWLATACSSSTSSTTRTPGETISNAAGSATTAVDRADPARRITASAAVSPPFRMQPAAGTITKLDVVRELEDVQYWAVGVTDAANQQAEYVLQMPKHLNLPFMTSTKVKIESDVVGGGPNATGRIAIVDDSGALLLAINRLPDGWHATYGTAGKLDKGDQYDERSYAVKIMPPNGPAFELWPAWRTVTIDNQRFYANGNAAKRTLHGDTRPPDYVGQWIDFAIVAVEDAP